MPKRKKVSILIVEDDQLLAKALEAKLLQEDFDVSFAIDGQSAVEAAVRDKPDVILLDLLLPIMGGFEVLSSLKLNDETKDIPVLILSNLSQAKEIERGQDLGAKEYLIKSDVSLKTVLEKIRGLLKL
jgi:DNA-binding response OmpR family regulator